MGLRDLIKNRKRTTIIVPSTFNSLEEAKISALYDEKERFIEKRIKARANHVLELIDGERRVPVLGDAIYRHGMQESAFLGGKLGDIAPLKPKQVRAWFKLRARLDALQLYYGNNNSFIQLLALLTRAAKDNILPTTISSRDVDVERVVISTKESLFPSMNYQLPPEEREREFEGMSAEERMYELKRMQLIREQQERMRREDVDFR